MTTVPLLYHGEADGIPQVLLTIIKSLEDMRSTTRICLATNHRCLIRIAPSNLLLSNHAVRTFQLYVVRTNLPFGLVTFPLRVWINCIKNNV